ncbi:MAG: phosphate/phosphite/phosphonate ABC transporter substrate-binding protein [Desulfovibrionaceae bacterium]
MRISAAAGAVLLLAALALAPACSEDDDALKVDLARRESISRDAPPRGVTYAYLPQYSHTISYARHHLLLEYLEQATGLRMTQLFPDTFNQHVVMVREGKIDISFSNPFIYTQLARRGAQAFGRIVEHSGGPDFRGQLICRAGDERIRSIEDCRGKSWIAVDPSSAGGYLFVLGMFHKHGLDKQDFSEVAFAPGPGGKQEKVVLSVYAGEHDIGSVREGTLELLRQRINLDQIRVLAESRAYPGWVYAARKGLDPQVTDKIAEALFRLDPNDPDDAVILAAAGFMGVIPATDSDYDPVRELAAELGLE